MFFFREIGRSVGNWETLPDGPEVRSGFYAARNYMVANKSWGSHKSTNTVRVWRALVRIINLSKIHEYFHEYFAEAMAAQNCDFQRHDFFNLFSRIIMYLNLSKGITYINDCNDISTFEKLLLFLEKLVSEIINCDFFVRHFFSWVKT